MNTENLSDEVDKISSSSWTPLLRPVSVVELSDCPGLLRLEEKKKRRKNDEKKEKKTEEKEEE